MESGFMNYNEGWIREILKDFPNYTPRDIFKATHKQIEYKDIIHIYEDIECQKISAFNPEKFESYKKTLIKGVNIG